MVAQHRLKAAPVGALLAAPSSCKVGAQFIAPGRACPVPTFWLSGRALRAEFDISHIFPHLCTIYQPCHSYGIRCPHSSSPPPAISTGCTGSRSGGLRTRRLRATPSLWTGRRADSAGPARGCCAAMKARGCRWMWLVWRVVTYRARQAAPLRFGPSFIRPCFMGRQPFVEFVFAGALGVFSVEMPAHWIGSDVFAGPIQGVFVADHVFVVVALP